MKRKEKYVVFTHVDMLVAIDSKKFNTHRDYVAKMFAFHHNVIITKFEELKYVYGKDKIKVTAHGSAYMEPK